MRLAHSTLLLLATLMGSALAVHATPVTFTFAASGGGFIPPSNLGGASYSGTITIDTSTYLVTAEDITATFSGAGTFYFNDPVFGTTNASNNYSSIANGETSSFASSSAGSAGVATLSISFLDPASGLYTGGPVFFNDSGLSFKTGGFAGVNGTIGPAVPVPAAATPEPSSLILLGTGILGVAGAARRRFLKA